eukprot:1181699-Rhodomonas_salina.1
MKLARHSERGCANPEHGRGIAWMRRKHLQHQQRVACETKNAGVCDITWSATRRIALVLVLLSAWGVFGEQVALPAAYQQLERQRRQRDQQNQTQARSLIFASIVALLFALQNARG